MVNTKNDYSIAMIPSTPNKLLVSEDWKKVYQSFRNADFKSYDFETLRRTMINYLRENYPEDFNDYIEDSEYIALIDLIAFLGQNLSFRIDLNARENFIETAERRDSVLRLARLISYNARRNVPASGLLKISSIMTTESVFDDSGINLANTIVGWNDPTNINWYQQFISIISAAMPAQVVYGKPLSSSVIDGIQTARYSINTRTTSTPVFTFTKTIGGTSMPFELVPCEFGTKQYVYESAPMPGSQFGFLYKNDKRGPSSANTGFFVHFKQGSINSSSFTLTTPVPNELIGINTNNINDSDVWLWQLSPDSSYHKTLWTKVSSVTGSNVIYNSISNLDRNIYTVITRNNDQIDLSFTDGSFGNLPSGDFKLYYRQSSGMTYTIKPEQMNNISVQMPYISKSGQQNVITLVLSLTQSVSNSQPSEPTSEIKLKAPQVFYTQNRMVTAEDYNISPLSASSDILKVKSINRTSSGISKYFELSDISGKYSSTNIFATDGVLYRDDTNKLFDFSVDNLNTATVALKTQLANAVNSNGMFSFYLDKYKRPSITGISWQLVNRSVSSCKGYFKDLLNQPVAINDSSPDAIKFLKAGTLIKFKGTPSLPYFTQNGKLTNIQTELTVEYVWVRVVSVINDGVGVTKTGVLTDGSGAVMLSKLIPQGAIIDQIIPAFQSVLSTSFLTSLLNLVSAKRSFGITFSASSRQWAVITESNIDLRSSFDLIYQQDVSSENKDSSWLVSFEWTGKKYIVRYRTTDYMFESNKETAFFVDQTSKNFDYVSSTVVKDCITVLSINKKPNQLTPLGADYRWQVDNSFVEPDGYVQPKKVMVSFFDANEDGQIDDPDSFLNIVNPTPGLTYVYFEKDPSTNMFTLLDTSVVDIRAFSVEDDVGNLTIDDDMKLFYFYSADVVKMFVYETREFILQPQYVAKVGRSSLKFHYVHNSGNERRIDPSKTNVIDIFLLSKSYDSDYRKWLSGQISTEPISPSSQSMEGMYMSKLSDIKTMSDEIVFHPAKYKVLFGAQAPKNLQANFKAVINPSRALNTKDLQTRILSAIQEFFNIDNWDFGQSFNFSELSTYVMNYMDLDIINFVIVPISGSSFGSLYQISCLSDEIFVSGATVENIIIIDSLTAAEMNLG